MTSISASEECAVAVPEPDHRRKTGAAKESRRQYSNARGHREAHIDYSDPFVRALLSPAIIGRLKEILNDPA